MGLPLTVYRLKAPTPDMRESSGRFVESFEQGDVWGTPEQVEPGLAYTAPLSLLLDLAPYLVILIVWRCIGGNGWEVGAWMLLAFIWGFVVFRGIAPPNPHARK